MKIYTSEQILKKENLYKLQDSFSSSGIPFKYQLTQGEINWLTFVKNKYNIGDFVVNNLDNKNILRFNCPFKMSEALKNDGNDYKAIMLSEETALQKLFFWLSIND